MPPMSTARSSSPAETKFAVVGTAAAACVVACLWLRRSQRKQGGGVGVDDGDVKPRGGGTASSASSSSSSCCSAHACLREHTNIFRKRVIRIADDVLVATGYGIANSICIRGESGLVIIDTCECSEVAAECMRDFRRESGGFESLRVAGIVYTHFHQDHVGGTDAFLLEQDGGASSSSSSESESEQTDDPDDGAGCVEIWAHRTTEIRMRQFGAVMGPVAYPRTARQFGTMLNKPLLENSGIGPCLKFDDTVSQVLPNRTYGGDADCANRDEADGTFGARRTIHIAGVTLELIHAPGETDDQTVVHMPSRSILFAADNYYEAFPNLYAIRGVPYRDPMMWVRSLDLMRSVGADIMVPSHTLPVIGRDTVERRLRNYRDAIAHVHDQTVRFALKGHHPDEIAHEVTLPAAIRGLEYLKEFYGTVHWSCKSIFHGYLGWFSGDPAELFALSPADRAARLVRLGGGGERCLAVARESREAGDLQWALEVVTAIARAPPGAPDLSRGVRREATAVRVAVLRELGAGQISANARNYYLTTSLEAGGEVDTALPRPRFEHGVMTTPVEDLLDAMRYRVDADAAGKKLGGGEEGRLRIDLTDSGKSFVLVMRNAVLTVLPVTGEDASSSEASSTMLGAGAVESQNPPALLVGISCTELAWKKFILAPVKSLLSGSFTFTTGSLADFRSFMLWFDRSMA